ncbi:hypothetical protein NEMIN01_2250 [Nematocida minor]|uniref:uncharacterized protein n=1 Tax=Nematocida minor TaxID=1912983 RepID=UPI00221E3F78|nr:uncharacterized protein NEMIN01_2250 [Nematocida minor]KAI5192834.1 hypothetical protein NEMIN01_2250 [Nematocida minor]
MQIENYRKRVLCSVLGVLLLAIKFVLCGLVPSTMNRQSADAHVRQVKEISGTNSTREHVMKSNICCREKNEEQVDWEWANKDPAILDNRKQELDRPDSREDAAESKCYKTNNNSRMKRTEELKSNPDAVDKYIERYLEIFPW